jgi:hypothetical protein
MSPEFYNGLQANYLHVCTKELVQILQYCQSKSVCTDREKDLKQNTYQSYEYHKKDAMKALIKKCGF